MSKLSTVWKSKIYLIDNNQNNDNHPHVAPINKAIQNASVQLL